MMTQMDMCLHRECTDTSDKNYVKKDEWNTIKIPIAITVHSNFYPASTGKCHPFLYCLYWDHSWRSQNRNLPTFQRFSHTYFAFSCDFEMCFVIPSELIVSTCCFQFPLYYSTYNLVHILLFMKFAVLSILHFLLALKGSSHILLMNHISAYTV
jgi:hypothetical protein